MKIPLRKLVCLGVLFASTAAVAVASDNQVVINSPSKQPQHEWRFPAFNSADDIMDQWVENGRQFITRNGQKCTCPRPERLNSWRVSYLVPLNICVYPSVATHRS